MAGKTGLANYTTFQKTTSETSLFMELIEAIKEPTAEEGPRGIFIKNTNEDKLQHILRVKKGERYEYDWLFCAQDNLICIELTASKIT